MCKLVTDSIFSYQIRLINSSRKKGGIIRCLPLHTHQNGHQIETTILIT
ncbi:hypothetical protein BACCOPRO_00895 [Phocaeicola coprophilus DSM 18228 = JCM 13818]|uniref:Uncharacterized protein n=1 Tax=Phocaeicola coprophilus DSM 18228 = JCM 13818 TaxID=547042 RepID=S0FA23_9BACT|nr:hypothetical protein BACCOPRO_00895 [Phocaeicola coprophilus DSM 18228 = JCM 13818]